MAGMIDADRASRIVHSFARHREGPEDRPQAGDQDGRQVDARAHDDGADERDAERRAGAERWTPSRTGS